MCSLSRLPGPGLGALDLHLDRHVGALGFGAVEHPVHPVDHRLLEPGLDLLHIVSVALEHEEARGQGDAYRFHSLKSKYREEYDALEGEARGQGEFP